MFTLYNGRLYKDGHPFFSVGFNYHPSRSGCQYWQKWDATCLAEDLQAMSRAGFNTVRFFIFWADFEPAPGEYDAEKIDRLRQFVEVARDQGLQCVPSLLTIWMNGQLFDLPWRHGRDLWRDPEMVARERAFVGHVAQSLRGADNVLAYDLGDEIIHVDYASSRALQRDSVHDWLQTLAKEIRRQHPSALVFQGNEVSAVANDHNFHPGNAQPLDLLGLHGFPVWAPFDVEGVASYKASSLVPFLVKIGRAHAPVLVDELGSYGCNEEISRDYLRATLHSALANGACGTLVWCWQDFTSREKPYALHPNERFVGLLRADGSPKPAMQEFRSFARQASKDWVGFEVPPAPIGVYVPACVNVAGTSYLDSPKSGAEAAFYAHLLLSRAHLPFEFTTVPLARYRLVICPSVQHLSLAEQEQLHDYVVQGGTLYYSCGDYLHGFGDTSLFGVRQQDFTLLEEGMDHFSWRGKTYPVRWNFCDQSKTRIPIIESTAAEVLAAYPNGSPALTRRPYGKGSAYYLGAPFELQVGGPYRLVSVAWHALYDELARSVGVRRELDADSPDVEVAVMHDGRRRLGFAINHAPRPLEVTLFRGAVAERSSIYAKVPLQPKGVYTTTWDV